MDVLEFNCKGALGDYTGPLLKYVWDEYLR